MSFDRKAVEERRRYMMTGHRRRSFGMDDPDDTPETMAAVLACEHTRMESRFAVDGEL